MREDFTERGTVISHSNSLRKSALIDFYPRKGLPPCTASGPRYSEQAHQITKASAQLKNSFFLGGGGWYPLWEHFPIAWSPLRIKWINYFYSMGYNDPFPPSLRAARNCVLQLSDQQRHICFAMHFVIEKFFV